MFELYENLLNQMRSLCLAVDESEQIIYVNSSMESALNAGRNSLTGRHISQVFEYADTMSPLIQKCFKSKQHIYLDRTAISSSTQRHIIFAHLFFWTETTPDQGVVFIEGQVIDANCLIEENKSHLSMDMVKSIAHEVKNPLGGIKGASQLLEKHIQTREHKQYLNIISKEADRLSAWLDRVSVSAVKTQMLPVNIHKVLEHVYSLMKAELIEAAYHITLKRDYDPSLPDITANSSALIQVFLNLARNAMQSLSNEAMDNKTITFKTRVQRDVTMHNQYHRNAMCIEVIDNGRGIDRHQMHQIFEPLVSFKSHGSGLGLAIAKDIVHQHQGDISVQSKPFISTSFSVKLPLLL